MAHISATRTILPLVHLLTADGASIRIATMLLHVTEATSTCLHLQVFKTAAAAFLLYIKQEPATY